MIMDFTQARQDLASIENARQMTGELRNYRHAGSTITAWGFVWLVGYGAQQFVPGFAGGIWLIGWVAALAWTATRPRTKYDAKASATWCVALAFILMLLWVIEADSRTAAVVFGLVLSAGYVMLGIWAGKRFALLGVIALFASCIGWWLVPQWLFSALALGGGFTLILGGFWVGRP